MLDTESKAKLGTRKFRGRKLVAAAWATKWSKMHPGDRESAAKDAISDMLTALFGPAGHSVKEAEADGEGFYRGEIVMDDDRINEAAAFLQSALRSYEGDAEDYWLA